MNNHGVEKFPYEGNYYNENDSKKQFPYTFASTTCPHCLRYISICGKSSDVKFCPYCGVSLEGEN